MKKRYVFQTLLLICLTACGSKDEFDATGTFEATEIVVSNSSLEQCLAESLTD
jgi:HlyD family secretion protein